MGRYDENQRARLKKNRRLAKQRLGPVVILSPTQQRIMAAYQRLRRQFPGDRGIAIPPDTDPIMSRHMYALDGVFMSDRAKEMAEIRAKQNAASQQRPAARLTR